MKKKLSDILMPMLIKLAKIKKLNYKLSPHSDYLTNFQHNIKTVTEQISILEDLIKQNPLEKDLIKGLSETNASAQKLLKEILDDKYKFDQRESEFIIH